MATKYPLPIPTDEDERTIVDPNAIESWADRSTVAEVAETSAGTNAENTKDVEALSSIVINQAIGSSSDIQTVDELTVEHQRESFTAGRPKKPLAEKIPEAWLVIQAGPARGQRFTLTKPMTTVGRALTNDIVIADLSVSKKHLIVEWDGQGFVIQDLASGNGTIVNGRDEDDRYTLRNLDALELGRSLISFECLAMEVVKPNVEPPKPKFDDKVPSASPHRATVEMAQSSHPLFDDSDDEVSTIAIQRDEFRALKRASQREEQNGEIARSVREKGNPVPARPRTTVPSKSAPPPVVKMPATHPERPVLVSLDDDEEPTIASSEPRARLLFSEKPGLNYRRSSQPAPVRLVPSQPAPVRLVPSRSSEPPLRYPSAPAQYSHSGLSGLNQRSSPQARFLILPKRTLNHRWIAVLVLLAVATVVGVTVAAISGETTTSSSQAINKNNDPSSIKQKNVLEQDSNKPSVNAIVVSHSVASHSRSSDKSAGTKPSIVAEDGEDGANNARITSGKLVNSKPSVNAIAKPLPLEAFGTNETILASMVGRPKPTIEKPTTTKPTTTKPTIEKPTTTKPTLDSQADKIDKTAIKKLLIRAEAAYRDRAFARSAKLTKLAARKSPPPKRGKLKKRATNLNKLQRLMSAAQSDNPIVALSAFSRAKQLDKRLGRRHQRFISAQIGIVGPKAARKYMSVQDYPAAARAVTRSRATGVKSELQPIVSSLEKRAGALVRDAAKAERRGDDDNARALLLKAKAMLPASSPMFSDVKKRLRSL